MSAMFPQLNGTPSPGAPPYQFAHLIVHPNQPSRHIIVEFPSLTQRVRQFLSTHISVHTRDTAPMILAIHGPPGVGKTVGAQQAVRTAGFASALVSVSKLAGETEGAATQILDAMFDEFTRWSTENRCRVAVIFDDFELSILNKPANVSVTPNYYLLTQRLQHLADNPHVYRNGDGSNMPYLCTLNDGTGLRESLLREGRAVHFDLVPSAEEKKNIAYAIFRPATSAERALMESLTRRFRHRNVAFWSSLYKQMQMNRPGFAGGSNS